MMNGIFIEQTPWNVSQILFPSYSEWQKAITFIRSDTAAMIFFFFFLILSC